ncbi:hypothetical protein V2G26_010607 [Clonostachys chloroleuca]
MAAAAVSIPRTPPKVVGPTTKGPTPPTEQLPQYIVEEGLRYEPVEFNATKHLQLEDPGRLYTMREIGLEGQGISNTAASEPFSLFSPAAIKQMRAEIFSPSVLSNCQYASSFATNMIRCYGPKLGPFIFDAWNSPEVLAHISKIAGVELVPALDFETGHVNVWINKGEEATPGKSAFSWHYDSYPFVCVTMLSDCTGMTGGETAMRTGNGDIMKVRGPAMGTAVVMQGRYIEHAALAASGVPERIAMVTSFRPKNPLIRDETILTGSRPITHRSMMYFQYSQYRLEVIRDRSDAALKKIRERERFGREFDIDAMREYLTEQRAYLESMLDELV